jgi:hypothetical protein
MQIKRCNGAIIEVLGDEGVAEDIVDFDIVELELLVIMRGWIDVSSKWCHGGDIEGYHL